MGRMRWNQPTLLQALPVAFALWACGAPASGGGDHTRSDPATEADPRYPTLGPPRAEGWRTRVDERGQSFDAYRESRPNPPVPSRRTLYLQPLGPYPREPVLPGDLPALQLEEEGYVSFVFSPTPTRLAEFVSAFYGLPASVLPEIALVDVAPEPVRIHNHHAQFDARSLLAALGSGLPPDGYSMTALVARDLVVDAEQEYAFGYGLHVDRLALASFVQLDPLFIGEDRSAEFQVRIRERSYKLLAHEVGHTLGMEHCDRYECVMNGVAHLSELDATPLHLCPICMRKLVWLVEVDQEARYRELAAHYAEVGLTRALDWVEARDRVEAVPAGSN